MCVRTGACPIVCAHVKCSTRAWAACTKLVSRRYTAFVLCPSLSRSVAVVSPLYRHYIAVGQPLRRPLQDPVAASADLELHVRLVDFDEVKQTWDMSVDERLSTAIEVRACACKRARPPARLCVRVRVRVRACL